MSDGKGPIGGTFEDISEAVVKPVTDELGKAIEVGVKSVVGSPNPQPATQVKQEEQQKSEVRRKIEFWKKLDEEQRKVRDAERQKQMQQQQVVTQEKQIKQFEIVKKKKENKALSFAQRKTEIRGGVGG